MEYIVAMRSFTIFLLVLFSVLAYAVDTTKPYTRWWWFGNSVSKESLTHQLEYMKSVGIGGVSIVPTDGQKGDEKNYINLLSPKYMEILEYVSDEAKRLGLEVDMTMGSGWPFGGPWISNELSPKFLDKSLKCAPTNFKVKRFSAGGAGLTANPFNPEAYRFHASVFKKAFKEAYADKKIIRAFFNDSYEYYSANWTENFLEEFKARRGYDFAPYMKELFGKTQTLKPENIERLWQDYHATIADLLLDTIKEFTKACKEMGVKSVNQAHGSVGNLIDLYAIADIPETESFGASEFDIDYVRQDEDYPEHIFGRPNKVMMKFAASASNLYGKKLVSAESCTWLANHFKTSLVQMKPEFDKLFVGGINHVSFHGMPYTPKEEDFPGRLFYASVNYNQNAHFKEFLPELNAYIKNVQQVLQNSKSDNDVLLYFPIHSFWKSAGSREFILLFDVHNATKWLKRAPAFDKLLAEMERKGVCYDFVSDNALKNLRVENGVIYSGDKSYKAIVLANVGQMPLETYKLLSGIILSGGNVVFDTSIPSDVSGFFDVATRQTTARNIIEQWHGKENVFVGEPIQMLAKAGVRIETLSDFGLDFIRKTTDNSTIYFIANQQKKFSNGKLQVKVNAQEIEYYNPMTQKRGVLKSTCNGDTTEFHLELLSGEACFIFANEKSSASKNVIISKQDSTATEIVSDWQIEFIRALPTPIPQEKMPAKISTKTLKSWTEIGDKNALEFCGVARYKTNFALAKNKTTKEYVLDLGDVRDCAKVWLNGKFLGSVWSAPFRVEIANGILKEQNTLEIEVSNNSFNRAKAFFARNPDWFKTHWIIDITYKKYRPETKAYEKSGLLGKVRLIERN